MAQYMITQTKHNQDINQALNTHRAMIGAPLIVILIFCFSFITMHRQNLGKVHANAASQEPVAVSSDKPKIEIKTALPAAAKLQPITVASPDTASNDDSGSSHGNSSPQSASQDQQKKQDGIPLLNQIRSTINFRL